MPQLGRNERGLPGPQRTESKGSVSRVNSASCLEEAGIRAGLVKQPVPKGYNGRVSPSIKHITDVKRRGPRPALTRCRCTGEGSLLRERFVQARSLPAENCSCLGRGRVSAARLPARQPEAGLPGGATARPSGHGPHSMSRTSGCGA